MKIIIVDENDKAVGLKERDQVKTKDIYRVSALWITNSKGDILLAQRKFTKLHDPGKWGPAVAGTVEEGETYGSNIIKEAYEELGLKNIKPVEGPVRRNYGLHNFFSKRFYLTLDKDIEYFKIAEDEVEQIKWFPIEELRELTKNKPEMFVGSMKNWKNEL